MPSPYHVQFLKTCTCQCFREILSIIKWFNLNPGLMLTAEGSLGLLNFTSEFLNSSVVLPHIFSSLFLVQFDEMCHDILIKIFTSYNTRTVETSLTISILQVLFSLSPLPFGWHLLGFILVAEDVLGQLSESRNYCNWGSDELWKKIFSGIFRLIRDVFLHVFLWFVRVICAHLIMVWNLFPLHKSGVKFVGDC